MPNLDGTGPFGDGRPGRGLGPCGRFGTTMRGRFGYGRGWRCGYGFHRGWRWYNYWYGEAMNFPLPDYYTHEELLAQKEELQKILQRIDQQLEKENK